MVGLPFSVALSDLNPHFKVTTITRLIMELLLDANNSSLSNGSVGQSVYQSISQFISQLCITVYK